MAMVLTQEGAVLKFNIRFGLKPPLSAPHVHLLGANYQIQHTDTEGILAGKELVAAGYAVQTLSANQWQIASIADGAQATYPNISWTLLASTTIYGYWISTGDDQTSVIGETFGTPFAIGPGGGTFQLQLTWYDVSQPFTLGPCF